MVPDSETHALLMCSVLHLGSGLGSHSEDVLTELCAQIIRSIFLAEVLLLTMPLNLTSYLPCASVSQNFFDTLHTLRNLIQLVAGSTVNPGILGNDGYKWIRVGRQAKVNMRRGQY
jgi:hypothetical protein